MKICSHPGVLSGHPLASWIFLKELPLGCHFYVPLLPNLGARYISNIRPEDIFPSFLLGSTSPHPHPPSPVTNPLIHRFIHSFNKYLLSTYYIQHTLLGAQTSWWIYKGMNALTAPIPWPPDANSWLTGRQPWWGVRLEAEGEEGNRGWDGWLASLTQWTCS